MAFQRNFLAPLRQGYSYKDSCLFMKYFTIPKTYLKGLFQAYPRSLEQVELSTLVDRCDSYYWGRIKMSQSKEEMMFNTRCKIARVPPMYVTRNELPATSGANLKVYCQMLEDAPGLASLGRVLYFHSAFEDTSLLAASNIIKAGLKSGLKCYMLTMNKFMEEVKTFEESTVLRAMESADLACISMLGTAYLAQSGFSEATLAAFVDQRRLAGKTTILSSHLSPTEFEERYKYSVERFGAVCLKFEDAKLVSTIQELGKELAALRKGV